MTNDSDTNHHDNVTFAPLNMMFLTFQNVDQLDDGWPESGEAKDRKSQRCKRKKKRTDEDDEDDEDNENDGDGEDDVKDKYLQTIF